MTWNGCRTHAFGKTVEKNGAEAKNQAKHCEYMQYFAWFSDMLCYLGLLCLPGPSWR